MPRSGKVFAQRKFSLGYGRQMEDRNPA